MNFGNVQGLKLSINCFADVKLKIADVKLKMTNSRRQFFTAVKNSEFQGLYMRKYGILANRIPLMCIALPQTCLFALRQPTPLNNCGI